LNYFNVYSGGGFEAGRAVGHPGGAVFIMLFVLKMQSIPLVRQTSKVDFHQAVFELLLLVLYKFLFQGLSGTTLFISMDYSYNPTSEPLLFGMTYVMGFTSNHKWVEFNTIILDL
jgi:hypothetical protein